MHAFLEHLSARYHAAWVVCATCVLVATAFIWVGIFGFLFFTLGPKLERLVMPKVYQNTTANYISVSPVEARLLVTGIKSRSCFLARATGQAETPAGWIQATVVLLDKDGNVLKPENQRIAVGEHFVRVVSVKPGGSHIKIEVEMTCHPMWTSSEAFVEINNPDPALVR